MHYLYQSDGPWCAPKFRFRSISWELIDRISPNFIYASILTRSSLGLLHVIFRLFVQELWPSIYAKISFPLKILRTDWHNFAKFYACIHIDKIYVGIDTRLFSHICNRVMALDVPQNFVSPQYQQSVISSPTLTRSTLGLSHDIFRTFVPELWPLNCPKI